MRISTEKYEFTHGKKPRGFATWFFEMTFTDGNGRFSTETVSSAGTLSEARKLAWHQIKTMCASAKTLTEVVVLP